MEEIILASGSPRRKELLTLIGVPFKVIKSDAREVITKTEPGEIVMELSMQKALDVCRQVREGRAGTEQLAGGQPEEKAFPTTILGADTIVCLDGQVLGKPADRADAKRMLQALQGRTHSVFTGVTLLDSRKEMTGRSFYRETKVMVHAMSEEEIEAYLDTGEPFDKAGAYGIQGAFAAYVDGIEGDYMNVVGLPVSAVYQALKEMDS